MVLEAGCFLQAIMLFRRSLVSHRLELTEHSLCFHGQEVPAQRIDRIVIQGYWAESVGIRLRGRRMVPFMLHFRFCERNEEGMQRLKRWADRNGVPIKKGQIYRWL